MEDLSRIKWAKIRKKGMLSYILFHGVLGWGIPTALGFSLLITWMNHNYSELPISSVLEQLLSAIIIFPIGGLGYGYWLWRIQEKKFLNQ